MARTKVFVLSTAVLLAAMLGRMGWVNWPLIATGAIATCIGLATMFLVLLVVCGPILLLAWSASSLVSFLTERRPAPAHGNATAEGA